ncbi:MAG: ABC transporter transmembrane domain-containing protein, partial [bacterium]
MLTQRPLPADVAAKLKPLLGKGERVQFHLASDLAADLTFGERWLVVTDRRVFVHPHLNGAPHGKANGKAPWELSLKSVESAELHAVVGGGVLVVKTKKGVHPLVHYSNSLSARFAEAAKGISQLAKKKPLELSTDLKSDRCPKCGRLLPDPNERCPFCVKILQALGRIVRYLRPYAAYTVFTVALTGGSTLLGLLPPQIIRIIVDKVLPTKDVGLLGWMVLGLLSINILSALLSVYNGKQLAWLGGRVGTDIRGQVFQAVERLGMKFFDRRHVGQIMSRVMNDSSQLQNFLIDGFPFLAQNALMVVGITAVLLYQSVTITLLIMLPLPLVFLGQFLFWKYIRGLSHKAWNQYALLNTRLAESVSGVRVVKAFSQESREVERFNKQNNRMFDAQYQV